MSIDVGQANLEHIKPQDLFLLSYPRSGNTYLRQMLSDIYFQLLGEDTSHPSFLIRHFFSASPTFDKHDLAEISRPGLGFFILKTHRAWIAGHVPFVYIYRQPEDAIVSYFRFRKKQPVAYMEEGLEAFVRAQINSWKLHVTSALSHRNNGYFVSYENLLARPALCLKGICELRGLAPTETQLEAAIVHNTPAVQRSRYIAVAGREVADYSIAAACVGGGVEFLSRELFEFVRATTAENFAALEANTFSVKPGVRIVD